MRCQPASRHKRILRLRDLSRLPDSTSRDSAAFIRPLKASLSLHLEGRPGYSVVLPSCIALASHLKRPVLEILQALQELASYGYQYEMSGLDSGVEVRLNPMSHYASQFSMLPARMQGRIYTGESRAHWHAQPLSPDPHSPLRRLTA